MSRAAGLALTAVLAMAGSGVLSACGGATEEASPGERASAILEEGFAERSPWIRAETIRLVGEARLEAFRPYVQAALEDESELVRTAAVEAMLRWQDPGAQEAALAGLVGGSVAQRVELLTLIVTTTDGRFRAEALQRSLRDVSPAVRLAALDHLRHLNLQPPQSDLQRMIDGDNPTLADRAFAELVRTNRGAATAIVLRELRSSDREVRDRGLRFARHLPLPELWRPMRSYAEDGESHRRAAALVVLGHLGDPWAEEGLRQVVLGGNDETAAEALRALAHIPTDTAREQPLQHRRDARAPVRGAALDAMIELRRPPSEFLVFLSDSDATLGERAFVYLQRRDPGFAAQSFAQVLEESEDAENVVAALYRASERRDVTTLLQATQARLESLRLHADPDVSALATRLLLQVVPAAELAPEIDARTQPGASYALLEAAIAADDAAWSPLFEAALDGDYFALRLAGAVGIARLGDRFTAPLES